MHPRELLERKFKQVRDSVNKDGSTEYMVRCPKCGRPWKLYANPSRNKFHCFRCGHAGSFTELVGLPDHLAAFMPKCKDAPRKEPRRETQSSPGQVVSVAALQPSHPAIRYLTADRARTFSAEELAGTFGVQYCVAGGAFADGLFETTGTLVFPMHMFGKLVGWQARLLYDPDKLTDDECEARGWPMDEDGAKRKRPPKYMTGPGFRKASSLFNFDQARKYPYVVVCEGVFDAMSVGPCAVAALGKELSQQQVMLLKSYWDCIILMLDANVDASKLEAQLSGDVTTIPVRLIGYKDPGDAPRDEIWAQICEAMRQRKMDVRQALELLSRDRLRATPPAVDGRQACPLKFLEFKPKEQQ